jgi:hypothetical protein
MLENIIMGVVILLFAIPFIYIFVADFWDVVTRLMNFTKPYITLLINKL